MTLSEARKTLEPPLVFGNDAQIKALKFLEDVEVASEKIAKCENGKDHLREFKKDDEIGFEKIYKCGCVATSFKGDVILAALTKLKEDDEVV